MRYITDIHRNKVYIKPKPKEDIKDGLVMMLNKPLSEKGEPYMARDVIAGQKAYYLPNLPKDVEIVGIFVKS